MLNIVLCLLLLGICGCDGQPSPRKIDLSKVEAVEGKLIPKSNGKPLTICVGSMITPKQGYEYYRQMLEYIGKKLNRPIRFQDKTTYQEVKNLLKMGETDLAFVCSQTYVEGHAEFGLELLAAPQVDGQTVYYSYIIVPRGSPVKQFSELRGKRFAFVDPLLNTGHLVPVYKLVQSGEKTDSYFSKYVYTYAHDKSIQYVAQGVVDGAAVDSLIWEYDRSFQPESTSMARVIEKIGPYGIQPVAVRPDLDPETKEKLRQVFLNMHQDKDGQNILKHMMIDKFVAIDNSRYDSIRQMLAYITVKQRNANKA